MVVLVSAMLGGEGVGGGGEGVVRTGEGSSVVATVAVALLLGEACGPSQASRPGPPRKLESSKKKARKQNEKTQKQQKRNNKQKLTTQRQDTVAKRGDENSPVL